MQTFKSLAVLAVVGAVTAIGGTATAATIDPTPDPQALALQLAQNGYTVEAPQSTTPASTPDSESADASAPANADSGLTAVSVPKDIDSSGATDVTSQLRKFFAQVPDHSLVEFPANGRFRVEDVVSVGGKHQFTLDGNGSTLFETTPGYRERSLLRVNGGSDVTIRDFHLVGAHPDGGIDGTYVKSLEAQHGIELLGTQRALIEHNTIRDVYGDFVYLQCDLRKGPTWREPARDITIRDNQFSSNGRQGVSFINADRVLVQNNTLDDLRRSVFDFEPTTTSALVENVTIDHNVIGLHRLNFVSGGGNGTTNDVMVSNNTLQGSAMNSMIKNRLGETRSNWSFIGNTSNKGYASSLGAVVVAWGAQGIQFRDNVQPMNRTQMKQGPMAGLRLEGGCGAIGANNDLGIYGGAQVIGHFGPCTGLVSLGKVATPAAVGSVS